MFYRKDDHFNQIKKEDPQKIILVSLHSENYLVFYVENFNNKKSPYKNPNGCIK